MSDVPLSWQGQFPEKLRDGLKRITASQKAAVFLAGGAVRDLLLNRPLRDLDLAVAPDPILFAKDLAACLQAPMFVLDEQEQVARIAWEPEIDVSGFRSGSHSIEEDLRCRDFTVNAMALPFSPEEGAFGEKPSLIDPLSGFCDLHDKIIRVTSPTAFAADPLRLLRAYRFAVTLDFSIDPQTARLIGAEKKRIRQSAPERIKYEMDLLFSASKSAGVVQQMQENGLLFELFPQLQSMKGVCQPLSHHLDVFNHSLATLQRLELVMAKPASFFPNSPSIGDYLRERRRKVLLKWAALWHDCGKPQTRGKRDGRITFYNHDQRGAAHFEEVAAKYRWSRKDTALVSNFISCHMWPFHLNNVYRRQGISRRACLRLVKRLQAELPGLFLLAMADSLAGEGPEKPVGLEVSLAELYREIYRVFQQELSVQMASPPLLTGHDLIRLFGLEPGPIFKEILEPIRDAQLCGELDDRQQALQQVRQLLTVRGYLAARHPKK